MASVAIVATVHGHRVGLVTQPAQFPSGSRRWVARMRAGPPAWVATNHTAVWITSSRSFSGIFGSDRRRCITVAAPIHRCEKSRWPRPTHWSSPISGCPPAQAPRRGRRDPPYAGRADANGDTPGASLGAPVPPNSDQYSTESADPARSTISGHRALVMAPHTDPACLTPTVGKATCIHDEQRAYRCHPHENAGRWVLLRRSPVNRPRVQEHPDRIGRQRPDQCRTAQARGQQPAR